MENGPAVKRDPASFGMSFDVPLSILSQGRAFSPHPIKSSPSIEDTNTVCEENTFTQ
jgi:hypothetical protein